MKTYPTLKNVRHLLLQKIILMDETTRQIGQVSQVFLHPTKGTLLGIAIRLENEPVPRFVALNYLLFSKLRPDDAQVVALTDSFSIVEEFEAGATTHQDFLGAEIVTDHGQLCGQIKEVYVREDTLQTIYQVKRPGLQGVLRPAYFVLGSEGDFYSYRQRRLILPHNLSQFKSLASAMNADVPTTAHSPIVSEVRHSPHLR